jgi:hypothetical protein
MQREEDSESDGSSQQFLGSKDVNNIRYSQICVQGLPLGPE